MQRLVAVRPLGTAVVIGLIVLAIVVATRPPRPIDAVANAQWAAYEYIGPGSEQEFHYVDAKPIVVTDEQWSVDWPENPPSILPLLTYREWRDRGPLDLSARRMTIRVDGDLELHGAYLRFWIFGDGTRWHLDYPIPLGRTVTVDLAPGPWQQSWARHDPAPVDRVLSRTRSYGLAFVGFSREVTGSLALELMRFD